MAPIIILLWIRVFKINSKFSIKFHLWSLANTEIHDCYSVLYRQRSLDDEPTVFLDTNSLSDDGTVSMSSMAFSIDGILMAYSLSDSGSDWSSIKIRNTETGEDYSDNLDRTKFSTIAWTHDSKGFFYSVRKIFHLNFWPRYQNNNKKCCIVSLSAFWVRKIIQPMA